MAVALGRRRVSIGAAVLVALVIIIALVLRYAIGGFDRSGGIAVSGTIEATQSDVAPKVEGRLIDLRVHDGDAVKKGEPVAVLERVDPGLDLDQAAANVQSAAAQVHAAQAAYEVQAVAYQTSLTQAGEGVDIAHSRLGQAGVNYGIEQHTAALAVDQARAGVASAQSTYDRAKIDLSRAASLASTGDVPQQSLDDATQAYKNAAAQLQTQRDALASAVANLRAVDVSRLDVAVSTQSHRQSIQSLVNAQAGKALVDERYAQMLAARAALAQTRAAFGLANDRVSETVLRAPFDGFVISHDVENGDLIEPGSPVLTIGDLVHPYAYVYVTESDLPRIKTGTKCRVWVDGMPSRAFEGTITEISNTAEFTPENVQTKEERIEYLVFRVKIQFTDRTGLLKPGLPVDAVIPA